MLTVLVQKRRETSRLPCLDIGPKSHCASPGWRPDLSKGGHGSHVGSQSADNGHERTGAMFRPVRDLVIPAPLVSRADPRASTPALNGTLRSDADGCALRTSAAPVSS